MPTLPAPHVATIPSRRLATIIAGSLVTVLLAGVALIVALRHGAPPVRDPLQALVEPMLDKALPTDLDRFSIGGDLYTLANCDGRLRDASRDRYGDSPDVMFGTVQDYVGRPFPIRFKAERNDAGRWTLVSSGFTTRDATPAEVQAQIDACAGALASKLNRAIERKAIRDRNAAAWNVGPTAH